MQFSWKRFWCPRNGRYSLSDDGYLLDPDGDHSLFFESDAVSFDKIKNKPCLGLLGEPGIGKSTALASILAELKSEIDAEGGDLLSLDLREYGAESRLERHIVKSKQFIDWTNGERTLTLVLDSLDECRIRIPNVAAFLIGLLKRNRALISRLRLRIACRTADWPAQFDTIFPELWGNTSYEAYELLPLRRRDIARAAEARSFDSASFLRAVSQANAQPLAIKPITLRFLLDTFKLDHRLPETQRELYEAGCRLLSMEASESRRDSGDVGALDPDARLEVAARIAAIMIFCRKTAVSLNLPEPSLSPDVVHVADLTGGFEECEGRRIPVDEGAIREVVASGLFSGRGQGLFGFGHTTYAEFLSARFLASRQFNLAQIKRLVCHRGATDHRIVPALAQAVAWIAGMDRRVFVEVMKTDPRMLLRSDTATASHSNRAALVAKSHII